MTLLPTNRERIRLIEQAARYLIEDRAADESGLAACVQDLREAITNGTDTDDLLEIIDDIEEVNPEDLPDSLGIIDGLLTSAVRGLEVSHPIYSMVIALRESWELPLA